MHDGEVDRFLGRPAVVVAVCLAAALGGCAPAPNGTAVPRPSASQSAVPIPSASPTASPTPHRPDACPTPPKHFVMHAPGEGKTVALTFDDGPGTVDAQLAAILDQYHVHATFFETGAHAAADPAAVAMLATHGNLIADHSWEHRYPTEVVGGWTMNYLNAQFGRTRDELRKQSGQSVCYLRPPGGFRSNVLATGERLGLTSVLWTTDSQDWQQPDHTTAAATARIVAHATAVDSDRHPIVLMHAGKASHEPDSVVSPYRGNTVAALPAVIDWYQRHGYRFVGLDGRS